MRLVPALIAASVATIAPAAELLVNGDAETGDFTGWTLDGSQIPMGDSVFGVVEFNAITMFSPIAGDWFFEFDAAPTDAAANSGVVARMWQSVDAPISGTPLLFSGWIASAGDGSCDPGRAVISFADSAGQPISSADTGWVLSDGVWQSFEMHVAVPAGATQVLVELLGRLDCGVWIDTYFDEISLFPVGCNRADLAEPFGLHDLADIVAFIDAFTLILDAADLDENGLFDLADVTVFVGEFVAGCP